MGCYCEWEGDCEAYCQVPYLYTQQNILHNKQSEGVSTSQNLIFQVLTYVICSTKLYWSDSCANFQNINEVLINCLYSLATSHNIMYRCGEHLQHAVNTVNVSFGPAVHMLICLLSEMSSILSLFGLQNLFFLVVLEFTFTCVVSVIEKSAKGIYQTKNTKIC